MNTVAPTLPTRLLLPSEEVVATLPVPTVVTDLAGSITELNDLAADLLIDPVRRRPVGKPLVAFVSLESRRDARCLLSGLTTASPPRTARLVLAPRGRPPVPIGVDVRVIDGQAVWVLRPDVPDTSPVAAAADGSGGQRAAALLELLAGLSGAGDVSLPHRLADVAGAALGAACGVWVREGNLPSPAAASDPLAAALDLAHGAAAGPVLDAWRSRRTVVAHAGDWAHWPQWAETANRSAAAEALAVPLLGGDERVGVLTAYAVEERAWNMPLVEDLALAGAGILSVAQRETAHDRLTEQLREAVTSREVIDQAKGIVMGQRRCTADEAFDVLVRISQQRNIRVRNVAEHLVRSVGSTGHSRSSNGR